MGRRCSDARVRPAPRRARGREGTRGLAPPGSWSEPPRPVSLERGVRCDPPSLAVSGASAFPTVWHGNIETHQKDSGRGRDGHHGLTCHPDGEAQEGPGVPIGEHLEPDLRRHGTHRLERTRSLRRRVDGEGVQRRFPRVSLKCPAPMQDMEATVDPAWISTSPASGAGRPTRWGVHKLVGRNASRGATFQWNLVGSKLDAITP